MSSHQLRYVSMEEVTFDKFKALFSTEYIYGNELFTSASGDYHKCCNSYLYFYSTIYMVFDDKIITKFVEFAKINS